MKVNQEFCWLKAMKMVKYSESTHVNKLEADKMKADQQISPAEWRVMRIVWTLGSCTSHEIIDLLQRRVDWKSATIKTLLRRLVDKGALSTEKKGRAFVYHPLVEEEATMCLAADNLFDNICERRVGATLYHVVENAELSKDDINWLQQLLNKKGKNAPDSVKCNCVPGREMNC